MQTYTGCKWLNGRWTHTWLDGTKIAAVRGRDEPKKKDEEGDKGGTGTGGDDGDDDDDDDEDDDDVDTSQIKDPVAKAIADTEARLRHKHKDKLAKAVQAERDRIKAEAELKDKPEIERLKTENQTLKTEADKWKATANQAAFNNAFASAAGGRFDDNEVAMAFAKKLPEWEDVEQDDDDPLTVNGLDKVVEALAKKRPSLLKKEGESEEQNPSGRPMNGKKKSKKEADNAELMKKYPALRR